MRTIQIEVKAKDGTLKQGHIMMPDTLEELINIAGPKQVFKAAVTDYAARARRRLASGSKPRRRLLKVHVDDLTSDQRVALIGAGLLQEE